MTITGRQIREARTLLGLHRSELAYKVQRITIRALMRAEEAEDGPTLSDEQAAAVLKTFERLGIKFTADPPHVRLRKGEP